ncbi:MAG: hypothetical protein L0154_22655 [Chloroflexi bacterium]|nr:hypothetical protein [Chloroflexota bacterium]
MSQKQLQKARDLISRQKYDKARKILQSLAFSSPEAASLLQHLNAVAPPQQKSGGIGLRWIIFGCIGCVGLPIAAVIFFVVILGIGLNEQQNQAEKANAGRGTKDKPIASGETIIFDNFNITLRQMIFPAADSVGFLGDPPSGAEYLIILVEMQCKKEGDSRCNSFDVDFALVADNDQEWDGTPFVNLDPAFGVGNAIGGGSFSGWIGFEFPSDGRQVKLVKVSALIGPTLYIEPPPERSS